MPVLNFIIDNYITLFELVGLLIILKISVHIPKRMKKLTFLAVILLLAEMVMFRLEEWTQSFETLSILRPILTASVYTIYPVILILLIQITSTKDHDFTRSQLLILLIPIVVSVPLYYSSQWTHYVCYFTEENHYLGGPLSSLPYFLFGFYCVVFFVFNVLYFKKYSRMDRVANYYIVAASLAGLALFMFFKSSADYSCIFTSAIVFYFLCIYIHLARIDSLTQLYNRQSYYKDLADYGEKICAVVSIDMNELKYLNDNKGHGAGDAALSEVSRVFRDHCGRGGTPYRVGGDEFLILYRNADESVVENAVSAMREELAKTPYSCAFGYSMRMAGEAVDEVIRRADDEMYRNKEEMKKNPDIHFR